MLGRLPASAARAVGLAAALALAGCGGSSSNGVAGQKPTAIFAAAKQAALTATSVHVAGSIAASGAPTTFDVSLVRGKGGRGTISAAGLTFELIRIGPTIYVKGTPDYYRRFTGATARRLRGKWLRGQAATGTLAAVGRFGDQQTVLDQVLPSQPHLKLVKGAATTVAGQRAIEVKDPLGGTLSVATSGQPYPVQIATGGPSGPTIAFDRWNAAVTLTAPTDAVDIDTPAVAPVK